MGFFSRMEMLLPEQTTVEEIIVSTG